MLRGSSKPSRPPPRAGTVPSGSGRLPSGHDARSGTYPAQGDMMMGYPTASGPIDHDVRYVARLGDSARSGTYPAQGGVMTGYPRAAGPTDRALSESARSGNSRASIDTTSHYASGSEIHSSIRSRLMANCLSESVLSSSSASQSSASVGSRISYDADKVRPPSADLKAGPPADLRPEFQAGLLPVSMGDRADGSPTPVAMGASHGVPAQLSEWGEFSAEQMRAVAYFYAHSGAVAARAVESAPALEPLVAAGPSYPALDRRPAARRSDVVSPDSLAPVLDRRPAVRMSPAAALDVRAAVPDPPVDVRAAAPESRPAAETGEKVDITFPASGMWEVETMSGYCAAYQTQTGGHMTAAGNVLAPANMLMNMLESKDEEIRILTGRLAASFEENKAEKEKLLETLTSFKRENEELMAQNAELWASRDQHVKTIRDQEIQIGLFADSITCVMKFAETMGSTLDSLATGVNGLKTLASERPVPGGYFQIRTRGDICHIMDYGLDTSHLNYDEVCRKLMAEIHKPEGPLAGLEEGGRGGDAGSFGPHTAISPTSLGTPLLSSASSIDSVKVRSQEGDSLAALPVTDQALLAPVGKEVDLEALKAARYSPHALNTFLDSFGDASGMPEFIKVACNTPEVRDCVPAIADDLIHEYVKLCGRKQGFTVNWIFEKLCFINVAPDLYDGDAFRLYRDRHPAQFPGSAAIPYGVPSDHTLFFRGTAVDFATNPNSFFHVFVANYMFWHTQNSDDVRRIFTGLGK